MKLYKRLFSFLLVLVLLISAVPFTAQAKGTILYGIGFTTGSDLRLRQQPSTSAKILAVAPKNEVVVVIDKTGDWYHVIYNMTEGYMHSNYVSVQTNQNAELGYGKINGTEVNLRTGPGTNYRAVTQGNTGDKVYILGLNGGWYKVIYGENICYIRSDYVDLTEIPYENAASTNSPLFFEGGKSTGVTPSASALNGSTTAPTPDATEATEATESTEPAETTAPTEETTSTTVPTENDGLVKGIGFVTASSLYLRSKPTTSSNALTSAPKNDVVVILGKEGDWYKVNYNLKEGYMHSDYLNVQTTGNAELGYGKVSGSSVNLRSGPSTSDSIVATAAQGATAYIIGVNNGWYKVIYGQSICYVRSDLLTLTEYPYENQASSNSPKFFRTGVSTGTEPSAEALGTTSGATTSGTVSSSNLGAQIVATAKKYLGTPYVWGGASPSGFDCSGFVYYILKTLGYSPYRTPADQYKMGTYVAKENLQPGDIVFFQNTYKSGISHVGIYVGDGMFIHSPNSRSVVSYADLNSSYYTSHYYGARRIG